MPPPARRLTFHGDGATLFGIYLKNLFLSIVTLGIYSFWGRTEIRKYFYSQTEVEGDRFAYHGTGKELLIGWLKALLFFALLVGLLVGLPQVWKGAAGQAVSLLLFYATIAVVIPIAMVGARRYRLSRSSWRGIRLSFRGHAKEFIKIYLGGILLTLVTFGIYSPWFQTNNRRFLVGHTYFGTTPFKFDGKGDDLVGRYVLTLLLTFPTLGLFWIWYVAYRERYYWEHTSFATARFRSTVTGGRLLGLIVVNLLLVLVTLGLGSPWVRVRSLRFLFDNLHIEGPLDLAAIQQEALAATATGEGLTEFVEADALDIDLGF